jgi:hypothetical protein
VLNIAYFKYWFLLPLLVDQIVPGILDP